MQAGKIGPAGRGRQGAGRQGSRQAESGTQRQGCRQASSYPIFNLTL
jgi:hypothetical protein